MFGFCDPNIEWKKDVPFSTISTIKLGGVCKRLAYPKNETSFVLLLSYLVKKNIPFRVVGCLSNTLPPDGDYPSLLISTKKMRDVIWHEDCVTASCGTRFAQIANEGMKRDTSALCELATIPGTVGAAVRGNAGVFGHSVDEYFLFGTVFDPKIGTVFSVKHHEMGFSYRNSILKESPFILINAAFRTRPSSKIEICRIMAENRKTRRIFQPHLEPSLGSVFLKNNQNESVSYYIDQAGLKGIGIGGVRISTKHAGFFVNNGNGTSKDFKELIYLVQRQMKSRYGWVPKCEIEFL